MAQKSQNPESSLSKRTSTSNNILLDRIAGTQPTNLADNLKFIIDPILKVALSSETDSKRHKLQRELDLERKERAILEIKITLLEKEKRGSNLPQQQHQQQQQSNNNSHTNSGYFQRSEIEGLMQDNEKWRALAKKQRKIISNSRVKEERVMKLLWAIRKQGINIDAIYDDHVRTPRNPEADQQSPQKLSNLIPHDVNALLSPDDGSHQTHFVYSSDKLRIPTSQSNYPLEMPDQYLRPIEQNPSLLHPIKQYATNPPFAKDFAQDSLFYDEESERNLSEGKTPAVNSQAGSLQSDFEGTNTYHYQKYLSRPNDEGADEYDDVHHSQHSNSQYFNQNNHNFEASFSNHNKMPPNLFQKPQPLQNIEYAYQGMQTQLPKTQAKEQDQLKDEEFALSDQSVTDSDSDVLSIAQNENASASYANKVIDEKLKGKLKINLGTIHVLEKPTSQGNMQPQNNQNLQEVYGYHDEFMNRFDEYSESWRAAIIAERRFP